MPGGKAELRANHLFGMFAVPREAANVDLHAER